MLYADTSALAKLVLSEPESEALRGYMRERGPFVSSALATTELIRAARRLRLGLEAQAEQLLTTLVLIDVDRDVLQTASTVAPPEVRTLDAIHIASALALGRELEAVLTYDVRMAEAARAAGLRVVAPA